MSRPERPSKKRPPRKKRPTRRQLENRVEALEANQKAEIYQISVSSAVRAAAMHGLVIYIKNPGLSVRNIWENFRVDEDSESPMIREVVAWDTFRTVAERNKWRKKREAFWHGVEHRVLNAMQDEIVQQELAEIPRLDMAGDRLLLYILGGEDADGNKVMPVRPKSLEGLAKALIDLDKYRAEKRRKLMERTAAAASEAGDDDLPEAGSVQLVGHPVPDELSDDEIEMFTHQLVAERAGLLLEDREVEDDDAGPGPERDDAGSAGEVGEE